MCGIAGAVWSDTRLAVSGSDLDRMTAALAHRGPDDAGSFHVDARENRQAHPGLGVGVALGFRRLSIIDLAGGHQPLANEDGQIQIVFNGEIYNYRELRKRIEAAGHTIRTQSDTETIVHLYEDLGTEAFKLLNGMFAIGIWDAYKQQFVLARDRLGKKPLYYCVQPGRLAFASELKSLLELQGIPREVNPSAVDHYVTFQYVPHPLTIYEGIHKLEPGHCLTYRNGKLTKRKYWDIDWAFEREIDHRGAVSGVRELLEDAVRVRLRSDVPLGTFLSGGIDSSLVTAIAQRESGQQLKTFSIGFDVKEFDETKYAQQVADHLGTDHHRFEVRMDAENMLDRLVRHYDEPFSDSSALPTWYLSELTRGEVTVALSGDGGDEAFAGYERYVALQRSQLLSKWLPIGRLFEGRFGEFLRSSPRQRSLLRRIGRFGQVLGQSPLHRYMNFIQIFGESSRVQLYRDDFIETLPAVDPMDFVRKAWNTVRGRDLVSKASLGDLQTYLPCDLMTKVDMASMAHSLEVRQPFLDYRLIEYAASLPSRFKLKGGIGKRILRDAFAELLPSAIWDRKKMGFGIPIAAWFRGPLQERTRASLTGSDCRLSKFFRQEYMTGLVESHMSGKSNEGYRLWNLLMLELWLREFT